MHVPKLVRWHLRHDVQQGPIRGVDPATARAKDEGPGLPMVDRHRPLVHGGQTQCVWRIGESVHASTRHLVMEMVLFTLLEDCLAIVGRLLLVLVLQWCKRVWRRNGRMWGKR